MSSISSNLKDLLGLAKGNGLKAHLVRGAAGSFGLKIAFTGLAFLASVLLARILGPSGYGVYAYAMTLVTLLAIPAELGLRQLAVRQLARYQVDEQWGLMRGLLVRGNQAVLAASLGLAALAATIAWLLRDYYTTQALVTFWIALVGLPLLALSRLREAALRGLRHVILGQVPEMLLRYGVFLLALGLGVVAWGTDWLGPAQAMAVHVGALAVAFLVGAIALLRKTPGQVKTATPAVEHRTWLSSTLPFMFIGGMQIINSRADIVMLGFFRPAEQIGAYRVATQVAILVAFPLQAMNMVVAPQFARVWQQGDRRRLQQVTTWNARAVAALSLPLAVGFIVAGDILIGTLFGAAFAAAAWPLAILCCGQAVNAGVGSVGLLLNATGHERQAAYAVALAALANIGLNASLIPSWGMTGAAAATGTSLMLWNGYMAAAIWYHTGLNPTAISKSV